MNLSLPIITLAVALGLPARAAAPANDAFANATVLTGEYMTVAGTTVGATREVNEPVNGGNESVWYKWTSPAYGFAEFGALFAPGAEDQRLEIYVGTGLNDLIRVGWDLDTDEPRTSINVGSGVTYYIRFAGYNSGDSPAAFNAYVDLDSSKFQQSQFKGTTFANDNFSQAGPVSGYHVKVLGYPTAASREAGEPVETGENTIWWKWVAPVNGKTIFSTAGSHVGSKNIMTIATGSRITDLSYKRVQWDSAGEIAIDARKGTTYYIGLGEVYYFGVENLSYILSIDHTADGGTSPGTGFKGRFLTLPKDLLDESLIKGEFSISGVTAWTITIDDSKFYITNSNLVKSGKKCKWQFNLGKKTFSVSPWKSKVVVTGYNGKKVVAKVTKEFRLW